MIKNFAQIINYIFIIFIFSSCIDNNYYENTLRVTLYEIPSLGGYSWFQSRFNDYQSKTEVIDLIKQTFDSTHHRFYIFAKPACSCEPAHSRFPYSMKVLVNAGIDTSYFEIYSMLKISSRHPYCSILIIRDLPSVYIIKDGIPVYSVIDSLLMDQYNIDTTLLVEDYILKGLQK
jgi:hypothetical protein